LTQIELERRSRDAHSDDVGSIQIRNAAMQVLTLGTRFGPYEVQALIGKGGMGEVYKAHDTRLRRDVALKVLPQAVAADADRLARFEREAQSLAALNHPHIAVIHGIEESNGIRALVMELVDGPTLAERIAQGPIPLDEAKAIACQIAEALEAAHETGIIHRDLKPANIKMRPDGAVKVLDFGLAKAREVAPLRSAVGETATVTSPALATHADVILGTAAYMSPEQAKGKPVDRRTDIWSWGVVLMEMLTGRPVFAGDSVQQVLAEVIKSEPDWTKLPSATTPNVQRLLRRCLNKDPKQRLDSAAVARLELSAHADDGQTSRRQSASTHPALILAVATLTIAAIATGYFWNRPTNTAPRQRATADRFMIEAPPATVFAGPGALSPDGQLIATQVRDKNATYSIWVKRLDESQFRGVNGTENGGVPFWSPDSKWIGFATIAGALMKVPASGGTATVLSARTGMFFGAHWLSNDDIIYSFDGVLHRIRGSGGTPIPLPVRSATDAKFLALPTVLDDGRHVLFAAARDLFPTSQVEIQLGTLDSDRAVRMAIGDSGFAFASNHVFFLRGQQIVAQRIDIGSATAVGEAMSLGEVPQSGLYPPSVLINATADTLVWNSLPSVDSSFSWFDRQGRETSTTGNVVAGNTAFSPRIAPDGRTVAFHRREPHTGVWDIWVQRSESTAPVRVTLEPSRNTDPVWSPDGRHLAYQSQRNGRFALYRRPIDGSAPAELLLQGNELEMIPSDWSSDGKYLVYTVLLWKSVTEVSEVWALPLDGTRVPFRISEHGYGGHLSPDGKWVAYASHESGPQEIYVRRFPKSTVKSQLTSLNSWAAHPRWRRDGRELIFWGGDNAIMSVKLSINEASVQAGAPTRLFGAQAAGLTDLRPHYDVSPDGQRFIFRPGNPSMSHVVVRNWSALVPQ
jgi:eukaryotic-like serine/threonine-protein kinase